jgi:tRNA/tmRNA/rRNA uracil-C5-methylase (TrmA/RlmC/RlmD family)
VREELGGASVFFPPGAFGQSNLPLFDTVLADIAARVPPGARVVEAYAGAGAIGLGLVASAADYAFNEVAPGSLAGLALGIQALPASVRGKARILSGPAADFTDELRDAELVIVDPPRRGLESSVLDALAHGSAGRIVYLSCDLGSLVRDTEQLVQRGHFTVREARAYALLPYTEHVETLVVFEGSERAGAPRAAPSSPLSFAAKSDS